MSKPVITITSVSMSKISRQAGENDCVAKFKSDQKLISWEARADGSGLGQGLLVGSGSPVIQTLGDLESFGYTLGTLEAMSYRADNFTYKPIVNPNTDVAFDVTGDELTNGDKTYRINVYGTNPAGESTDYGS